MTGEPTWSPGNGVVAFDLDGTLVRGSSFGQFVRLLICASPWRLLIGLLASPAVALVALLPRWRTRVLAAFVWLATFGRSADELRRRARTFAGWHAGPDSGNRIAAALARLEAHQNEGDRVLVVTAAVDPVAGEVVRALGISGVELVAPQLCRTVGGWIPEPGRSGNGKVARMRAADVPLPIEHAYTDSAHDIPLLLAARYRHAVQPRSRHFRAIRSAVPDCTIITSDESAMMSSTCKRSRGST